MQVDLTIPQTFTIENKTNEVVAIRHYFVNAQERLQPGDSITVSPKSSEELAYYMEIQKDLETTNVAENDLLTQEIAEKILSAMESIGTVIEFHKVSSTLATMVIDYRNFTRDTELTTEVDISKIWDGAQISNEKNLVTFSDEKGFCIYDNGLDRIVGEEWIQE